MDQLFLELYHRHVGMGFDRQLRFAEFLERKAPGAGWEYDTHTAVLAFGPKVRFEAPVIGSHAEQNDSWLWAVANRNLRLTITNRALGDTVRHFAPRLSIPAFASKTPVDLASLVGSDLALHAVQLFGVVLIGELEFDAYYSAPYESGKALLLVRDDRLRIVERSPLARVLQVFPRLLLEMPITDPRAALAGYARAYGLDLADGAGTLKLTGEGAGEVVALFDDRGRFVSIEGTIPAPKARPKPAPRPVPARTKAPARVVAKKKPAGPMPIRAKPVKAKGKPAAGKHTAKGKSAAKKPGKKR